MPTTSTIPQRPSVGDLFGDSPRARKSNPHTSHEAADSNNVNASIGLVLEWFRSFGPMADHELVAELGTSYTPQRLRTARAALVERGELEASGLYRLTPSRRRAVVWQLKEAQA